MKKKRKAVILFYEGDNILLQDRRRPEGRKHGEEYGFFGGGIELGETPEQALVREIKEELSIDLKEFEFFKTTNMILEEFNIDLERNLFIAPIPDLNKVDVKEGKLALMRFSDASKLKMVKGDLDLIEDFQASIMK